VLLAYASLLEKLSVVLAEAKRLHADAPTPEHAVLIKELTDPVLHLMKLTSLVARPRAKR
jgi:hypothetical protein